MNANVTEKTKLCFWNFFSVMKVTCTPIACFVCRLFILNSIFQRGSKWTHKSPKKQSKFAKKSSIWSLFFMVKVNCMPTACSKVWLFILNAFFFSLYVVAYYAHSHLNRCSKWTYKSPKNRLILLENVLIEILFPWWRSLVFQMLIRYFNYLS